MMSTIIQKFTRGGDLLMDTYAGKLSTEKSRLMLLCHRRFVGCDIDVGCIKEATPSMVLVFSWQAPNRDSDIKVEEDVGMACKVYVAAEGPNRVRQRRDQWKAPTTMPPT